VMRGCSENTHRAHATNELSRLRGVDPERANGSQSKQAASSTRRSPPFREGRPDAPTRPACTPSAAE
jgi:hypothetical protein